MWRFGFASASLLLYLISLCLPALGVGGASRVYRGFECLVELPLALMYSAWWANPVFAMGIILAYVGKRVAGGICGVIALLFSLSYFLYVIQDFEYNLEPVRIGYWFWVAAMSVLAASLFPPWPPAARVPEGPS